MRPPAVRLAGGQAAGAGGSLWFLGEVSEWLKERDWKSRGRGQPASRVRIPPSPLASCCFVLAWRGRKTSERPDRCLGDVRTYRPAFCLPRSGTVARSAPFAVQSEAAASAESTREGERSPARRTCGNGGTRDRPPSAGCGPPAVSWLPFADAAGSRNDRTPFVFDVLAVRGFVIAA